MLVARNALGFGLFKQMLNRGCMVSYPAIFCGLLSEMDLRNNLATMKLGEVLRKWRLMTELTLRDVAEEIGISAPTLMRFEQGDNPDGPTLAKILTWLLTVEESPKAARRTKKKEDQR